MQKRLAVGGVALSFLLAVGVALSGVLAAGGGTALGASTTLTVISGNVLVSRDGGPFTAAVDGEVLDAGDAIRTGDEARAVLTYFEGSTVTVEPWSELSIDEASADADGSTVVLMTQNLGRTWHVVTKLISGGSRYEVRTPAATASVRGTAFQVGVVQGASGEIVTEVVTTEGTVAAAAPATPADPAPPAVLVRAGFQTTARSSERAPEPPVRAPDPVRTVSVNVGSENTLVVDPLGRANGVTEGKLVLQTPGASVTQVNGRVLVTMPDIPDGKIATVVNRKPSSGGGNDSGAVEVTTTVAERGKAANTVTERIVPTEGPVTTGVEVRQSDDPAPEATPAIRPLRGDEAKDLPTPKTAGERGPVAELPIIGPALRAVVPGSGAAAADGTSRGASDQRTATEPDGPVRRADPQSTSSSGFFPSIPLGALPGAQAERLEEERRRAEEERKRFEAEAARAAEAKRAADEAARRAEEEARRAAEEAAKRVREEQERARKAAEEAARRAEDDARRAAEAARKAAVEAAQRAEEQARQAAEEAKKAAEEAARRAAEQARQEAEERRQKAISETKAELDAAKVRHAAARELVRLAQDALRAEQDKPVPDPIALAKATAALEVARAARDATAAEVAQLEAKLAGL